MSSPSGFEERFLRKLKEQPPAAAFKPQAKRSSRPKAAPQAKQSSNKALFKRSALQAKRSARKKAKGIHIAFSLFIGYG